MGMGPKKQEKQTDNPTKKKKQGCIHATLTDVVQASKTNKHA